VAASLDRPLGFTEALCAEWYDAIPDGLQVVGALAWGEPIAADDLRAAVARVRARHPALASCIVRGADDVWRFATAPGDRVELRVIPAGSAWRDRYAAALAEPLDLTRALWRVELVVDPADAPEPAVLIVTACHAVLDGISLAQVLHDLVTDDASTGSRAPLAPCASMEDLLPAHAPATAGTPAPGTVPEAECWRVEQPAPASARTFGFTDRTVDAAVVRALHERARAEHTTLAAALMVACCRARTAVPGHRPLVGFNVPFDLRSRVTPPIPAATVGAYFGRAHVFGDGPAADRDPWAAARTLDDALRADIATAAPPPAWDATTVRALVAGLCRDDRTTFDLAYLLTDLGRVDLGPHASGMWCTTVQTTGVEALVVSAAGVAGALDLGIGWPRPLTGDATATAFADALVAGVHALAQPLSH